MKRLFASSLIFTCSLQLARALAPYETALLINQNSPESKQLANEYAALRNIPPGNRILLDIPLEMLGNKSELSTTEFQKRIRKPVRAALKARGLEDQILAWIYSADFPTKISNPHLSLHGMTLLGEALPEGKAVQQGTWLSPYYAGPDKPNGPKVPGYSLVRYKAQLRDKTPIPSMSLGHIGAWGNELPTVIEQLKRSATGDFSRPNGPVWVLKSNDVRSRCREWQWEEVQTELKAQGRDLVISEAPPLRNRKLSGMVAGNAWIRFSTGQLLPGSFAEHLTSFGARYDTKDQTKTGHWIRAGAAGSTGTVHEPFAIWTKFPHARTHVHLGTGATLLESLYHGTRSPLQLFMEGDALARPFAPKFSTRIEQSVSDAEIKLKAITVGLPAGVKTYHAFLLNGRLLAPYSDASEIRLQTERMPKGHHRFQLVVFTAGNIAHYASDDVLVQAPVDDQQLQLIPPDEPPPYGTPFKLRFQTTEKTKEVELFYGHDQVARASAKDGFLEVPTTLLGEGPVQLWAQAVYGRKTRFRSAPVSLVIAPPVLATSQVIVSQKLSANKWVTTCKESVTNCRWFENKLSQLAAAASPSLAEQNQDLIIPPESNLRVWKTEAQDWQDLEADFMLRGHKSSPQDLFLFIAFNLEDDNNFDYFGFDGGKSIWTFGSMKKGTAHHATQRGRAVTFGKFNQIGVRKEGRMLQGIVNHRIVATWKRSTKETAVGLAVTGAVKVSVSNFGTSPPEAIQQDQPEVITHQAERPAIYLKATSTRNTP